MSHPVKTDKEDHASYSGFTLVELLVVIAIVCIIAAILFPVFAAAREKARETTCQSNLRQLGLAFQQYSNDNDDRLPLPGSADQFDDQQNGPYWDLGDPSGGGPIDAYLHSRSSGARPGPSVFLCPDMPAYFETPNSITGITPPTTFQQLTARTYVMNWYLRDPSRDAAGQLVYAEQEFPDPDPAVTAGLFGEVGEFTNPLSIVHLIDPSVTVLLFEGVPVKGVTSFGPYQGSARRSGDFSFEKGYMPSSATSEDIYTAEGIGTAALDPTPAWHNGMNNRLFCDGHVKAMPVHPYPWVPTSTENYWYVQESR